MHNVLQWTSYPFSNEDADSTALGRTPSFLAINLCPIHGNGNKPHSIFSYVFYLYMLAFYKVHTDVLYPNVFLQVFCPIHWNNCVPTLLFSPSLFLSLSLSSSLSFQSTIKHFYSQFFLCKWGPCPGVQLWTVWKRKKTSGPTASRWWGIGTTPWSWTRFRAPPTILLSLLFFLLPLPHAHLPGLLFEYMISILQSG